MSGLERARRIALWVAILFWPTIAGILLLLATGCACEPHLEFDDGGIEAYLECPF